MSGKLAKINNKKPISIVDLQLHLLTKNNTVYIITILKGTPYAVQRQIRLH